MSIKELSKSIIKRSEKYSEVLSACYTLLKHCEHARDDLEYLKSRVDGKSIVTFGWFPPNEYLHLLTEMIDEQDLIDLDLIYKKYIDDNGHSRQVNYGILSNHNLVMPYHNSYGDIIGLVGRNLLPKEEQKQKRISKYKNSNILKMLNLFGLHKAKQNIVEKDSVIIVEGQFDCITCHKFGINNVVALGGASFSKYHFYTLRRFTKNLYFALDNDDAAEKTYSKVLNRYGNLANIRKVTINSRYKDIDEALLKGGTESLSFYSENQYG